MPTQSQEKQSIVYKFRKDWNEKFLFSVSDILPTGQLSNIPWRRSGVKYTNNEAYFDVVEEVDAIIDKSGATVFAEIQGYVSYTYTSLIKFN